jgi:DNA-binding NarL/FixJ family response regulator
VQTASILLVDDNPAILHHVCKMLNNQFRILAAFGDGRTLLREYATLRPDVIILDIAMSELNGIEVARHLRESGYAYKIIFLTVHEDPDFVNAALGAGGSAYVVKSRLDTDLIPAISAVLSGKLFVSTPLLYTRT